MRFFSNLVENERVTKRITMEAKKFARRIERKFLYKG